MSEFLESVQRLTRDLRNAAITLSTQEARFLVDAYYAMQGDRIRAAHQLRTLGEGGEPHDVMGWLGNQREVLETQVRRALDAYSGADPVGVWMRSIHGIGPVISAGLLCHIDITQAPSAGHIWRYAGLDPTTKWLGRAKAAELVNEYKGAIDDMALFQIATKANISPVTLIARLKGKRTRPDVIAAVAKRPWNGDLKRLCFLIGESFVKVSGNDDAYYGKIYKYRKQQENDRNEQKAFSVQAQHSLSSKNYGSDTQARKFYEQGMLPPARIHLRACRYAVKWFLADLQCVWWYHTTGSPPVKPYVIDHMGHADYQHPPNADMFAGLVQALTSKDGRGTAAA